MDTLTREKKKQHIELYSAITAYLEMNIDK